MDPGTGTVLVQLGPRSAAFIITIYALILVHQELLPLGGLSFPILLTGIVGLIVGNAKGLIERQ
jgi:mannose/fructose/N-acetylgalactosamine-specific phosphotransferase system component IIC